MIPVLWLYGPPGVGKSVVAFEIYSQLVAQGNDCAYVDIDQLGICYPEPPSDPGRHLLKARNLAAVASGFSGAGARGLVVSGVVDALRGVEVPNIPRSALTVCRLRADRDELTRRLGDRPGSLVRLEDALRDAEVLDCTNFADVSLDTSGRSVSEVAAEVLEQVGHWPAMTSTGLPPLTAPGSERSPEAADGPILWLSGPRGVGKSTIGFAAYLSLRRRGLMTAFINVGQLGFCSSAPADQGLRSRNLAAVWQTFRSVGARPRRDRSVQDQAEALVYEGALPRATFTWCRVHAGSEQLTSRILSRGAGGSWPQPGDPLRGQSMSRLVEVAQEAALEAERLEVTGVGQRVDTDGLTAENTAELILSQLGWPGDPG